MLRFLADENLNHQIVHGVLRQNPNVDLVRVQDVGLSEADDPTVLEWAVQQRLRPERSAERQVVLTHDVTGIECL